MASIARSPPRPLSPPGIVSASASAPAWAPLSGQRRCAGEGTLGVNLVLNILWFIFGGFAAGLGWLIGALVLAITIVGLPWAPAALRIGLLAFAPFGREAVPTSLAYGDQFGAGCLGGLVDI